MKKLHDALWPVLVLAVIASIGLSFTTPLNAFPRDERNAIWGAIFLANPPGSKLMVRSTSASFSAYEDEKFLRPDNVPEDVWQSFLSQNKVERPLRFPVSLGGVPVEVVQGENLSPPPASSKTMACFLSDVGFNADQSKALAYVVLVNKDGCTGTYYLLSRVDGRWEVQGKRPGGGGVF